MSTAQSKRIKIQAVIASILVLTTGCIAIRENITRTARQKAYQTILAAKQVQNDEEVLKASKDFLNNASVFGQDTRMPQVIEIYEESLVRWFSQQPSAQLTAENKEYLEFYKQLQKTVSLQEKQS